MPERELDTLVVYCHPWEGSFNHAVLEALCAGLERAGRSYEVCDLYADGFRPAMTREELAGYAEGRVLDPLVGRYQRQLARCRRLALVFPVWWNDVPAMLRGWLDRVMLPGFSWVATGSGIEGRLGHIERVDAFTTSANPTDYMRERLGDGIQGTLIGATFWQLGVTRGAWHNFGSIDLSTPESRAGWLEEVGRLAAACEDEGGR